VGALLSWNVLWTFTTGWNHLYYLFVLLQLFVIYVLFFPRKGSSRAQTIFFVVAVVLTLLFNLISELVYLKYGADKHHFEWTYGKVFAAWISFFAWGIIIGARPTLAEWLRKRLWLLLAVSIAVFIVYYYQISNRPTLHLPAELGWCKDIHFRSSQAYLPYTLRLTGFIFVLSIVSKRRGGEGLTQFLSSGSHLI
jgi:hypothetical protein